MKNIFKGKLKFIILLILIILGLVYYFTHRNKKEKIYINDYSYMEVKKTDEIGTLNLNGYIKANNPIGIFVDKKLKVKEVFIKNGDFVKKGQVLMTFDDDETNKLNRNIEKERINLQKIQRDLKTTRELQKLEVVDSLEILVISPSYTLSSSEISCLTLTLCPNFTDWELYSGISTIILKSLESIISKSEESVSTK